MVQVARERYRALEAKIERMEAEEERRWQQARTPAIPAFDMAKWKQQEYAESARWEQQQAYQRYRQGEWAEPQPQKKSWWQKAGDWLQQKVVQPVRQAARTIVSAWKPPQTAGSSKLAAPAKDGGQPPPENLWERIKDWWRVMNLKLEAPAYPPPDAGSGQHGVREPTWADFVFEKVLQAGATKFRLQGYDDAARHMSHYLGNSGRELKVSVDEMMAEMPQFKSAVQGTLTYMVAENFGSANPTQGIELNFESGWTKFYATPEVSPNWFYAMGGYYYWVGANAKVLSVQESGKAVIKVVYKVAVSDYYNWDAGKSTSFEKPEWLSIPSLPETYEGKIIDLGNTLIIQDTALAELHKAEIAQEYHIAGQTGKTVSYYKYDPATSKLIPINP